MLWPAVGGVASTAEYIWALAGERWTARAAPGPSIRTAAIPAAAINLRNTPTLECPEQMHCRASASPLVILHVIGPNARSHPRDDPRDDPCRRRRAVGLGSGLADRLPGRARGAA